jgi:hypothetical protein
LERRLNFESYHEIGLCEERTNPIQHHSLAFHLFEPIRIHILDDCRLLSIVKKLTAKVERLKVIFKLANLNRQLSQFQREIANFEQDCHDLLRATDYMLSNDSPRKWREEIRQCISAWNELKPKFSEPELASFADLVKKEKR